MQKYRAALEKEGWEELERIIQIENHPPQKALNALVLPNCNQGQFQERPMKNGGVASVSQSACTILGRARRRFVEEGLGCTLAGRKGARVYERKADGDLETRGSVRRSEPPEGHGR